MQWTNNAKIFNLNDPKNWDDHTTYQNNQGSKLLITVTDESMYDRYHPNDTVEILINNNPPENSDCLILLNDEVSFRQISPDEDNDEVYIVSRTWPFRSKRVKKEDINILGYATGILRT